MHPALLKLGTLRLGGTLRRLGRAFKSVRGALLAAFGLLILVLLMLPTFSPQYLRSDPAVVRTVAPLAILLFCLMSLLTAPDKAINFSMAEVEFLFPGPFTRRELLLYKLIESAVRRRLYRPDLLARLSLLVHLVDRRLDRHLALVALRSIAEHGGRPRNPNHRRARLYARP